MNTIYLSLLLALFGGIISFIKDWKSKKEEGFTKSNWITVIALLLLLVGSFEAFFISKKAVLDQKISDSTALAKDSLNQIYKDSLLAFQNKIIRMQQREIDTSNYIIDLSKMLILSQQDEIKLQSKIRNEITGGESKPTLSILVWQPTYDSVISSEKFLIYFSVSNKEANTVQDVRVTINDMWIYEYEQKSRRRYFLTPFVSGTRDVSTEELKSFNGINKFDGIGNLVPNIKQPFYATELCPQLFALNPFFYSVEIKWHNGVFNYYLNLKYQNHRLLLDSSLLFFNAKKIKAEKYLEYNEQ